MDKDLALGLFGKEEAEEAKGNKEKVEELIEELLQEISPLGFGILDLIEILVGILLTKEKSKGLENEQ